MAHDGRDRERERHRSGAAGADRLRDEIDRGGSGDKVAFLDPAAAPLGTDDEAGGHPPTRDQVETAREQETRHAEPQREKQMPAERQAPGPTWKAGLIFAALTATVFLIGLSVLVL